MTYRNQCSKLLCNKIGDSRCLLLESLIILGNQESPHTHTHARTHGRVRTRAQLSQYADHPGPDKHPKESSYPLPLHTRPRRLRSCRPFRGLGDSAGVP